ncbi:alpha/beta-hydrolase [Aspergillus campestris IBT 28561]|uniref:Alpha/beta-hydrolase n=1 Tax=Aspergillus campestris (strain IBT 28561) TaxID=1392248 RepID=A0A2I1CVN3_ASPC2|nr:alpha/beta-hydrolase [Aspergillus campestris IBT 28561]PKY01693.1 alpha/beta-hydrolase [Aspergillus campestris IBT 28561]
MIDHVLGRPSTKFRKIQVFAVFVFWSLYLSRGNKHGPPALRNLSSRLSQRLTVWQTTVGVFLWLYVCRNFAKVMGLECPEPLANLYSRSFFRATWITTALDAGFWTAMKIRPGWLRDIASLTFTVYYLFAAEQADEKVRRVRATLTVDHLRVSWNKGTTPYLWALASLMRPRLTKYPPRAIRIPRPPQSAYREPTHAWLYFDGPLSTLRDQTCVILDVPGGGFVAMDPRSSEDRLLSWAGRTKVPILSLDYKKAPEYPYPYALNECFDVYQTLVTTRGRCAGLSGQTRPRIVITGDSAGANLAVGTALMVLESGGPTGSPRWDGEIPLPRPDGLVLAYPALNVRVESWMTEEQMSLIQDKSARRTNRNVVQRKNMEYERLTPFTSPGPSSVDNLWKSALPEADGEAVGPQPTSDEIEERLQQENIAVQAAALADNQPKPVRTRIAVSSMISYVHDRILTPEMMRAMIILYIGPHNRPDFSTDFLLSPVLAPEALLARFPKTYIITGERDPLVDDTVIFAGRLRQAKLRQFRERQELGLERLRREFDEKDHVEVSLLPGVSHGFLQMAGFFPESRKHIARCATWIQHLFETAAQRDESTGLRHARSGHPVFPDPFDGEQPRHHVRRQTDELSADEDRPLEMGARTVAPLTQRSDLSGNAPPREDGTSQATRSPGPSHNKPSTTGVVSPERTELHRKRRNAPSRISLPGADGSVSGERPGAERPRAPSLGSLSSEEDLLDRRMNGLAGGLMGMGEGAQTP